MIKIAAKMMVKEGKAEVFQATAKELVERSAAETGNMCFASECSFL